MPKSIPLTLLAVTLLLAHSVKAASNAGAELRRLQDETRENLRNQPRLQQGQQGSWSSPSEQAAKASQSRLHVQGYKLVGVTRFSDEELAEVLKPYSGRELDTEQLHQAADALMQYYRAAGYFVAKVFVPPQNLYDGLITLDVYEGQLQAGGLEVKNSGQRINSQLVSDMLADRLSPDKPLQRQDMERVLLLVEDLPGVAGNATLYPGQEVGKARLRTEISDEPLLSGNIDVDNYGSEHSGRERLGTTLYLNSPSQTGDQLVTRLVTSGSDSNYAYLTYLAPVSASGTRLGASLDYYQYQTDNIDNLGDAQGYASDLRLYLTHPLVRSRHSNLNLRSDYSHLRLVDDNDLNFDAIRHVDSLTLGIEGDEDHDWLANGLTLYGFSLTAGALDMRGNYNFRQYDRSGPGSDGGFVRSNVYLQRLQHLSGPWSIYGKLGGQWASGNLDASQKYYLGGPTSVAGYPLGEVGGDSAVELHAELRYDVARPVLNGQLQAELFYQKAWLKTHEDPWSNWQGSNPDLHNEFTLDGAGIGLTQTWQQQWLLRGLIGWQMTDSPVEDPVTHENTDGIDGNYRAWVQLIRYF